MRIVQIVERIVAVTLAVTLVLVLLPCGLAVWALSAGMDVLDERSA